MRCWMTVGAAATIAALRRGETRRIRMLAMTATRTTITTASREMSGSMEVTRAQVVATPGSAAPTTRTPVAATWASAGSTPAAVMTPGAASTLAGPILGVGPTPAAGTSGSDAVVDVTPHLSAERVTKHVRHRRLGLFDLALGAPQLEGVREVTIDNPFWEAIKDCVAADSFRGNPVVGEFRLDQSVEESMKRVPNRQLLARKYCWTIPDPDTVAFRGQARSRRPGRSDGGYGLLGLSTCADGRECRLLRPESGYGPGDQWLARRRPLRRGLREGRRRSGGTAP